MHTIKRFILLPLLLMFGALHAQNFHGIQGSSFAGSLGVHNNPASILSTPNTWDLTLLAFQLKSSTNAFVIKNYSLLSSPANSAYTITGGDFSRFANLNFNLQLLNARIALSRTKAIAFGANIRGYTRVKTSEFNFVDTLHNAADFFKQNENQSQNPMSGDGTSSSWLELFGTYSQTIFDNTVNRLNAGVTVKVSRGVSGAFTRVRNQGFNTIPAGGENMYTLKQTAASYSYSSNYDLWKDDKDTKQNMKDFLKHTQGGVSLDFGFEYIIKSQAIPSIFDGDYYYDYDWKIGASLLDVGVSQFKPSSYSYNIGVADGTVDDKMLDEKFQGIESAQQFNDSMLSMATAGAAQIQDVYRIINPVRIVLNVDKPLGNDFYVNGELSINLSQLAGNKRLYVKEINLLTVTPRWETKRWGVYLPIIYNTEKQFWIGGAFKAGPLLFGVHNWANIFAKDKMQNGGGYIALVIRSFNMTSSKADKHYDCPPDVNR